MKILKTWLIITICLFCSFSANAYHFYAGGIYCNILSSSDLTVEVTYKEQYTYNSYSGDIIIPETVTYKDKIYSVTTIGDAAFFGCSSLTSVTIPNSVTTIGNGAFDRCNLTSIIVGKDNPKYDSRENCNAIIHTSSNSLICGCEETIIPNNVTSIGSFAFEGRLNLTSIIIPNSVTKIESSAFYGCENLKEIYSKASNPPVIHGNTFSDYTCKLYVPKGCKSAYEAADYWKEFTNIIEE